MIIADLTNRVKCLTIFLMSNAIEPIKPIQTISLKIDQERLRTNMQRFKQNTRAKSTLRAYSGAWARFEKFCQTNNAIALPADPAVVCIDACQWRSACWGASKAR